MDTIVRNMPSSPVSDFVTMGMRGILIIAANVPMNTAARAPVIQRALERSSLDSSIHAVHTINATIVIPIRIRYVSSSLWYVADSECFPSSVSFSCQISIGFLLVFFAMLQIVFAQIVTD